jgi:glutathione S-transferase
MSDPATASTDVIRLTYVKGYGLAEQARWLLAATVGGAWENVGFETHQQFLKLKEEDGKLLFHQVPLLEIDGRCLVQSQAIVRYLARRGGLTGQTEDEVVLVDMVCENIKDLRRPIDATPWAQDKESVVKSANELVGTYFPHLDKLLAENKGQFVTSGLSVADILLCEAVHGLVVDGKLVSEDVLVKYPNVSVAYKRVVAMPEIANYLRSDKRYPFPHGDIATQYVANVRKTLHGVDV